MLRSGPASLPPSRRFRVCVFLSALLLLWMSVAQAAHHHGSLTDGAKARASNIASFEANDPGTSELACPICIVSHSVLPSFPVLVSRLDPRGETLSCVHQPPEAAGFWSYDLFGRPPPQT